MQLLFVAILVASCYSCHGNGASEGRFVDAAESIMDSAFPSEVLAAKAVDVKVLRIGKCKQDRRVCRDKELLFPHIPDRPESS